MSDENPTLVERGKKLVAKIQESRPVRAYMRYTKERGNLLAGGIAYVSLLSVGSALVVGFTIMSSVLSGAPELQSKVIDAVAQQLPGLLEVNGEDGLVKPEDLFRQNFLSFAGLGSLALALWSGASWLNAVREGIRAVWRMQPDDDFIALKKLRDIGIMGVVGVLVLGSAVISIVINAAAAPLLELVGLDGTMVGRVVLRTLGAAVVLALDTVMLMVVFRLLTGIKLPAGVLLQGSVAGAVGFGALKLFAGTLLGGASGNPVLAGSAVLVGLMLWLNFNARITLVAASWVAESALDHGVYDLRAAEEGYDEAKVVPDHSEPIGPLPPTQVPVGRRKRDMASLGGGVVLGAVVLGGARALSYLRKDDDASAH